MIRSRQVRPSRRMSDFCAVYGNKNLVKVILPTTLKSIGNFAFAGCDNLATVVFRSYYAPVLEGTMSSEIVITPDTEDQFPGFELLYGYDYFYKKMYQLGTAYYYSNFKDVIGSMGASGMTAIVPDNCSGYDSLLYKAYFTLSETTSGATAGKYALDFIEAVNKIPANVDRFDRLFIADAIVAYNALARHTDELAYITDEILAKYTAACTAYYVDVAEDKIDHLFDMAYNKYSFDIVKDALATYDALSDSDKALVSNSDKLAAKVSELESKFGTSLDFNKTYEDYAPVVEPPAEIDPPAEPPVNNTVDAWVIILVASVAAVVVAGAAVVFILIKKKRA